MAGPADDRALGRPDPAAVTTSEQDRRRAFLDAALVLRRRIELFASLPLEKLTRLALQARLDDIGRASSAAESKAAFRMSTPGTRLASVPIQNALT